MRKIKRRAKARAKQLRTNRRGKNRGPDHWALFFKRLEGMKEAAHQLAESFFGFGTAVRNFSGDPGRDTHRDRAAKMFGVPVEQVTEEQRKAAKTRYFAQNYGIIASLSDLARS